jgi:hypothetical protein
MTHAENFNELMKQIGPLLDLLEVNASTEEPHWTMAWGDGTVVSADYDPEDHRVTLTADVGVMPEDKPATAELLLQFNGLWHQTGGLRMGTMDGHILQLYDFFAVDLDLPTLSGILTGFVEKARAWEELLASSATAAPAESGTEAAVEDMLRFGIRA